MTTQELPVSTHHIVHRRAPREWHNGLPLGNGEVGVMVWGDGNPLAFTLDRSDLWDLRRTGGYLADPDFNYANLQRLVAEERFAEVDEIFEKREERDNPVGPTKINIGRAELYLGKTLECESRLDLASATLEGSFERSMVNTGFRHWSTGTAPSSVCASPTCPRRPGFRRHACRPHRGVARILGRISGLAARTADGIPLVLRSLPSGWPARFRTTPPMYGWHTVQFGWSNSAWLGWLVSLRWRYSLDREWLAETGYPVLAEIFRFDQANLR